MWFCVIFYWWWCTIFFTYFYFLTFRILCTQSLERYNYLNAFFSLYWSTKQKLTSHDFTTQFIIGRDPESRVYSHADAAPSFLSVLKQPALSLEPWTAWRLRQHRLPPVRMLPCKLVHGVSAVEESLERALLSPGVEDERGAQQTLRMWELTFIFVYSE